MNLQGGDNTISNDLYDFAVREIKDGSSVLNFGCGVHFNFEKYLNSKKKAQIASVDVLKPESVPDFVDEFVLGSVEESLDFRGEFDVVTFFEVIEHIDKTDMLLKNCFNNLKKGGQLIFSFPNLSSFHGRLSLTLGFQPCVLEVSNESSSFGRGPFGKFFSGGVVDNKTIHHIRGITYKAMKEMVAFHGFEVIKVIGFSHQLGKVFYYLPGLAPVDIFICRKK